ncbi:MAG: YIP1 family protein [Sandaracinaceae bacterium]|nr:YIP1 family protein [Sandaracinaceae bacterium]
MAEPSTQELPQGARCAVHPERSARIVCARCGDFACLECATLLSEARYCERCAPDAGPRFPFEDRHEKGTLRAAVETVRGVLLRPSALFARPMRERSSLPALALGMALSVPFEIASAWIAVLRLPDVHGTESFVALQTRHALIATAASPLKYLVTTMVAAAAWWIGLAVVRGSRRPFAHTLRALAYVGGATAPLGLLAHLPAPAGSIASALGSILVLTIQVRALRALHRVELWRVVLALVIGGALLVALLTPLILLAPGLRTGAF